MEKLIAGNPNARRLYAIEELLEAGLVLQGTEVKSLRQQSPNLRDAYVEIHSTKTRVEGWLVNAHFAPYSHGNIWNHESVRKRKILLHHRELVKLYSAVSQKGMTIVPTRLYFKNGKVKVEIGIGKGKKNFDKRNTLKEKTLDREMDISRKASASRGSNRDES